ncbi:MAG: glycosyltransferase family 9 protein, partial [Selenomonadaceae bacterium]|nr:glycosyltransferase family 9 protein [Selenomonadaceae bacterium]
VDADEIKKFMEPYFEEAGYRETENKSKQKFNRNKSHSKNEQKYKNILILHDAGIGDFIIMSSSIREIRRIYPKANITLLITQFSYSMAECCPYVDKLFIFSERLKKYADFFNYYKNLIEVVRQLLRHKTDIVFSFGQFAGALLLSYMTGAKEIMNVYGLSATSKDILQAGNIPSNFFESFTTIKNNLDGLNNPHDNERNLQTLQNYSKVRIQNRKLEIWFSPMDNFLAEINLRSVDNKKLYAISMGGGMHLAAKRWAPENYAKLMNMILAEEDVMFVILGGTDEEEDSKIVESLVDKNHIINFTNKLNFRQSAAILNLCDCYIGNDTGMMHAATVLKLPVLNINCFPADINMTPLSFPQRYYPYDVPSVIVQPKHALPECENSISPLRTTIGCTAGKPHCINQITPENVFQAFKHLQKQIAKNATEPVFFNL